VQDKVTCKNALVLFLAALGERSVTC
jgi:hypothetical protein